MSLHDVGAQAVSRAGVGCLHELSYLLLNFYWVIRILVWWEGVEIVC